MPQKLHTFGDGGFIEFDTGNFDKWCVFITLPEGTKYAPSDIRYFKRLKKLGEKHGHRKIYDDFVVVFNRTTADVNPDLFQIISLFSRFYQKDALEIEIWLSVIYAGMVAEENKKNAILKKRIKRLGIHQILLDDMEPEAAARFSKGLKWQELDRLMKAKGF